MTPLFIVLLVFFTIVVGVWALILFGAVAGSERASGILAWLACVILGVVIFLAGTGALVLRN